MVAFVTPVRVTAREAAASPRTCLMYPPLLCAPTGTPEAWVLVNAVFSVTLEPLMDAMYAVSICPPDVPPGGSRRGTSQ